MTESANETQTTLQRGRRLNELDDWMETLDGDALMALTSETVQQKATFYGLETGDVLTLKELYLSQKASGGKQGA